MKEYVQKLLFENIQLREHAFTELLAKHEEAKEEIERAGLISLRNREQLMYVLQAKIEKTMYEDRIYDDLEAIVEKTMKAWNESEALKISGAVMEGIVLRLFKTPMQRKAFGEICEGDIESMKLFSQDANFFAHYVLRQLLSYENIQQRFVLPTFTWLYNTYFEGDAEAAYVTAAKRLSVFSSKFRDRPIIMGKGVEIGAIAKAEQLPFVAAFDTLYKNLYAAADEKTLPSLVKKFIAIYVLKTEQLRERRDGAVKQEPQAEKALQAAVEQPNVTPAVVVAPVQETVAPSQPATTIDAIIAQLQQLKEEVAVPAPAPVMTPAETTDAREAAHDAQLKIAEEEIARLRQTIAAKDAQLAEVKAQTYEQLIELIGGTRSNYLLSDLYKESLGENEYPRELVQGQLLNLFNYLSTVMQLEPVSNGYAIGEQFTCERAELTRQYRVLSHIEGNDATIHLTLLQYGWSMNGKVVVQPLVAQLKEVQ